MAVFVVTWNLNREPKRDYNLARKNFLEQLEKLANVADPDLESVRWVETRKTANELDHFLREKMDDNDGLFVSRLRADEYGGWLADEVVKWIAAKV